MHKLRGGCTTFSTSGKQWLPFKYNPKIAQRNAKLHRMIRNGTIKHMTKDEQRNATAIAVQQYEQRNAR